MWDKIVTHCSCFGHGKIPPLRLSYPTRLRLVGYERRRGGIFPYPKHGQRVTDNIPRVDVPIDVKGRLITNHNIHVPHEVLSPRPTNQLQKLRRRMRSAGKSACLIWIR